MNADAFGVLTKRPQNVLVLENQDAQLNCSTDGAAGNSLEWTHDHDRIVLSRCQSMVPKLFVVSSPDPITDCDIKALASLTDNDISGAYVCSDRIDRATAMVIVLGSILIGLLCASPN